MFYCCQVFFVHNYFVVQLLHLNFLMPLTLISITMNTVNF